MANHLDSAPSSSSASRPVAEHLLRQAREGKGEAVGQLLETYRNYLQLLASARIDRRLQARVSASDLVQEALMGAYRDFEQFRGESEGQLLAWLRQILINRLHVVVQQHVLAEKRGVHRERSLEDIGAAFARSTTNLQAGMFFADRGPSPSTQMLRRERAVELANHLAQMSPQYREVIVLRNLQGLSFQEIAEQTGRSSGAARMLWLRAIRQLREQMEQETEP